MRKIFLTVIFAFLPFVSLMSQDRVSGTIEFVVNTDTIIENGNYHRFKNDIVPIVVQNKDKIASVLFIGSASPEGTKPWNEHLSSIRADKIMSLIPFEIDGWKVIKKNDQNEFIEKTGRSEFDYPGLRAAYFEITFSKSDTVYIENTLVRTDTVYVEIEKEHKTVTKRSYVAALNTELLSDMLLAPSLGAEWYTNVFGLSLFVDTKFCWWKFGAYNYKIAGGFAGVRKYFKEDYSGGFLEAYGMCGYYDLGKVDDRFRGIAYGAGVGAGYSFRMSKHITISPFIRAGWVGYQDNERADNFNPNLFIYENEDVIIVNVGEMTEYTRNKNFFGPTLLGVKLKYEITFNKN